MSQRLLIPFSRLYAAITDVRNWLYDRKLYESYVADPCVIAVGNLTVGGTGKTPMIEYLIKRHINDRANKPVETATLSRGYGRKTNGFRIATDHDTAETIGDEPLQLYRKFKHQVRVCVGERRADAIRKLLDLEPGIKQILLDDAFQHRAVQPHLNLLLTDYTRPFYADYPFPAGRLRERRHGARRADAIIVTKCPDGLNTTEQAAIRAKIQPYARPDTPILFARLHYGQPIAFADQKPVDWLSEVILVSGLGNAKPLEEYVQRTFSIKKNHRFADHYAYTRADFDQLIRSIAPGDVLLTTEKDWVKLDALLTADERLRLPLYYLPVEMMFLPDDKAKFAALVDNVLLKNR
ncbi:tetraacyldisaccharide 4'-kinase [Spirosoma agri]|uniref:tetraacyldisaccharide 4'-kinase n=1 Tax=Spirosoma agri TaxID=1987381 RepID=UPI00293BE1F6|nr:tetraacyldisaccharide 4'-kinase [Spirosoma agri]